MQEVLSAQAIEGSKKRNLKHWWGSKTPVYFKGDLRVIRAKTDPTSNSTIDKARHKRPPNEKKNMIIKKTKFASMEDAIAFTEAHYAEDERSIPGRVPIINGDLSYEEKVLCFRKYGIWPSCWGARLYVPTQKDIVRWTKQDEQCHDAEANSNCKKRARPVYKERQTRPLLHDTDDEDEPVQSKRVRFTRLQKYGSVPTPVNKNEEPMDCFAVLRKTTIITPSLSSIVKEVIEGNVPRVYDYLSRDDWRHYIRRTMSKRFHIKPIHGECLDGPDLRTWPLIKQLFKEDDFQTTKGKGGIHGPRIGVCGNSIDFANTRSGIAAAKFVLTLRLFLYPVDGLWRRADIGHHGHALLRGSGIVYLGVHLSPKNLLCVKYEGGNAVGYSVIGQDSNVYLCEWVYFQ